MGVTESAISSVVERRVAMILFMHSVRVRSAPPGHRFDMKMLILLTQICKCSFLLHLSNHNLAGLPGLNSQNIGIIYAGGIGLHYYSDQARYINFYAHVGYFKCRVKLK